MFCDQCGTQIPDESQFCLKCGSKVIRSEKIRSNKNQSNQDIRKVWKDITSEEVKEKHTYEYESKKPKTYALLFAALVVFVSLIFICSYSSRKNSPDRKSPDTFEDLRTLANSTVEDEEISPEYLSRFRSLLVEVSDNHANEEELNSWNNLYDDKVRIFVDRTWQEWQASYNDLESMNVEYVSGEFQNTLGFDYNNENISDSELLRLDFPSMESNFDETSSRLRGVIDTARTALGDLINLAGTSSTEIESIAAMQLIKIRLDECSLKIDSIHDRVFIALSNRAVQLHQEARLMELGNRFNENYEEGVHTTWHKHVSIPRYVNSRSWAIYPLIGIRDGGQKWLCVTLGFHRSDWIFIDHGGSITVVCDGVDHRVNYDPYTDVDTYIGGGIAEWVGLCSEESLIRSIANAERVVVSFSGNNGNRRIEHALTASEMTAFRETVEYYDLLR